MNYNAVYRVNECYVLLERHIVDTGNLIACKVGVKHVKLILSGASDRVVCVSEKVELDCFVYVIAVNDGYLKLF